jgi:pyruvate kinase
MQNRSTKIVATLGPAINSPAMLEKMIESGVDMFRLNFSHGTAEEHIARAKIVRELAAKAGKAVAIMVDLQGPKIRVGKFKNGKITLKAGERFILDATCEEGDETRVGLDYKELVKDVKPGNVLLLDDGRLVLDVEQVIGSEIISVVRVGGILSNNKGINQQGGGLSAPALTAKDMEDIKSAGIIEADYVAVSFPKSGVDMHMARTLVQATGSSALLIAKIERTEAITYLEEILDASDGIMVARGDLAVEVGDARVPGLQKQMIRLARDKNKLTITATQMMESMIHSPVPTRAEVSDVANAVLDGTDAVMLSAESAVGEYPIETVLAMARVCSEAEKSLIKELDMAFIQQGEFSRVDQAVSMASLFVANHLKVKAIAALTQSGSSVRCMSRFNCGVPIYALTPNPTTYRAMALFRDVYPIMSGHVKASRSQQLAATEKELIYNGVVQPGDLVLVIYGDTIGLQGGTNTMKIIRIGEFRNSK